MEQTTKTSTKTNSLSPRSFPPAQLWLGHHEETLKQTKEYLQKIYCTSSNACKTCMPCQQIQDEQHHDVVWLIPEKNYTLDQLSIIFSTITFALEPGEQFFFVIQKADFLPPACANSLLKSIEEPPEGYHFILLAQRQENILPTIQSRCVTQSFYGSDTTQAYQDLYAFFTTTKSANPNTFLKTLDQSRITEPASIDLMDSLLQHWLATSKKALIDNDQDTYKDAQRVIGILKEALAMPPMPGSSKMAWKNLFLQIKG